MSEAEKAWCAAGLGRCLPARHAPTAPLGRTAQDGRTRGRPGQSRLPPGRRARPRPQASCSRGRDGPGRRRPAHAIARAVRARRRPPAATATAGRPLASCAWLGGPTPRGAAPATEMTAAILRARRRAHPRGADVPAPAGTPVRSARVPLPTAPQEGRPQARHAASSHTSAQMPLPTAPRPARAARATAPPRDPPLVGHPAPAQPRWGSLGVVPPGQYFRPATAPRPARRQMNPEQARPRCLACRGLGTRRRGRWVARPEAGRDCR